MSDHMIIVITSQKYDLSMAEATAMYYNVKNGDPEKYNDFLESIAEYYYNI